MSVFPGALKEILFGAAVWSIAAYWFTPWFYGRRNELIRFSRKWYLIRASQVVFSLFMGTVLFLTRTEKGLILFVLVVVSVIAIVAIYEKWKSARINPTSSQ